jgi:hypothetical protein
MILRMTRVRRVPSMVDEKRAPDISVNGVAASREVDREYVNQLVDTPNRDADDCIYTHVQITHAKDISTNEQDSLNAKRI